MIYLKIKTLKNVKQFCNVVKIATVEKKTYFVNLTDFYRFMER